MQLADRTVLVTGGSRGIGREACISFAKEGADVIVHYRAEAAAASEVAAEVERLGRRAGTAQADVADEDSVARLFEVVDSFTAERGLNVLFNNAGIYPAGTIDDITVEQWDEVFAVNARGTFLTTRAALKHLRRASGGRRIINIGSVIPGLGAPGLLHYSASKAAITNFTCWLSTYMCQNVGPDVRVNAIAPGFFLTEQNRFLLTDKDSGALTPRGQSIIDHTPMGRFGEPEDVSGAGEAWTVTCDPSSTFPIGRV